MNVPWKARQYLDARFRSHQSGFLPVAKAHSKGGNVRGCQRNIADGHVMRVYNYSDHRKLMFLNARETQVVKKTSSSQERHNVLHEIGYTG